MSAMSLISLFSLSLFGAEFSFIASIRCGFGSMILFPKSVWIVCSFSWKANDSNGSSIGTKPSRVLIFGWMWSTIGSMYSWKIWYSGSFADSSRVSSFPLSMLKSFISLKPTAVMEFFECFDCGCEFRVY
jgi:hypothetical protein